MQIAQSKLAQGVLTTLVDRLQQQSDNERTSKIIFQLSDVQEKLSKGQFKSIGKLHSAVTTVWRNTLNSSRPGERIYNVAQAHKNLYETWMHKMCLIPASKLSKDKVSHRKRDRRFDAPQKKSSKKQKLARVSQQKRNNNSSNSIFTQSDVGVTRNLFQNFPKRVIDSSPLHPSDPQHGHMSPEKWKSPQHKSSLKTRVSKTQMLQRPRRASARLQRRGNSIERSPNGTNNNMNSVSSFAVPEAPIRLKCLPTTREELTVRITRSYRGELSSNNSCLPPRWSIKNDTDNFCCPSFLPRPFPMQTIRNEIIFLAETIVDEVASLTPKTQHEISYIASSRYNSTISKNSLMKLMLNEIRSLKSIVEMFLNDDIEAQKQREQDACGMNDILSDNESEYETSDDETY